MEAIAMFGTLPVCVALLVSMVPVPPEPKPMEPTAFLAACKAQESALSKFFADENNWKPERKAEMLVQLKIAGVVRPMAIVPTLLKHIDYYDDPYVIHRKPTQEMLYPVYGALKKYGAVAIPELMTHLKRADPVVAGRPADLEASLSVRLLSDVSDERKCGAAIARIRIQYEMDRTPNAEFPRLKALLTSVLLK